MERHLYPILYAIALWWASTGAIIFLYRLPRSTYAISFAGFTLGLIAALYGLWATAADTSLPATYLSFTCGTLVWGWQLAGFYMGLVTGPALAPAPRQFGEIVRFRRAISASLHHELAALAALALVWALVWGSPNQLGAWTYLLLYGMHLLSKLNIFLGARNFNISLLPAHLHFLGEFFRNRPMNLLFPFTVTAAVAVATLLIRWALAPEASAYQAVAGTFLGFLTFLGLLEIWLLMIPPAGAAWGDSTGLPHDS